MRLIIFLLALVSAFFHINAHANSDIEPDMSDLVPAELQTTWQKMCTLNGDPSFPVDSVSECKSAAQSSIEPDTSRYDYVCEIKSGGESTGANAGYEYKRVIYAPIPAACGAGGSSQLTRYWNYAETELGEDYICPPSEHPEHTIPVEDNMCAKPKGDCGMGYWNEYMSEVITGKKNHCEPRDCDQSGTTKGINLIPGHDGQGFSSTSGGVYCNDGCAYEVQPEQVNHSGSAYATSTGQHCDVFGSPNKKISELDDLANCTAAETPEGKPTLSCPDGSSDNGDDDTNGNDNQDPINNDDKKKTGDDTEDQPKNTCADDDIGCKTENVEIAIENAVEKLIKNDNELHNLMIDVHTANTVSVVDALNEIKSSSEINDSMELLLLENLESHLKALVAIESEKNGDGGGDGETDGNNDTGGNTDGECAPSVDDCTNAGDDSCTADYCDANLNTEQAEEQIKNYFENEEPMPNEVTNVIDSYTSFVSNNFAGFLGTCTPFPLEVQLSSVNIKNTWNIGEHCEPYDNFVRPILEWFIWVITVNVIFSIFYRTIIEMSKN